MSLCHETLSILRDLDRRVMELEKTTASLKRRCELLEVLRDKQEEQDTQDSWIHRFVAAAHDYRNAAVGVNDKFQKLLEVAREAP